MTRSILIATFLLFLFFERTSLYRCYHCRITQYGYCQHPERYYPPIAYCGATQAVCGTVNVSLEYTSNGNPRMSFGDKYSRWAQFKGCVNSGYCSESLQTKFSKIGGVVGECKTCSEDLCNSADSNLIRFVKPFIFGIVTVFIVIN